MDIEPVPPAPSHLSRPEAIGQLRDKLKTLTDSEHCVCAIAERLGFPCHGFSQLSDAEFVKRFDWIARTRPHATRKELEEYVNLYLLGRQESTGAALACDVETREHDLCGGWNTFDNAQLEGFFKEVFGRAVSIG
jgi:hypothetical protein